MWFKSLYFLKMNWQFAPHINIMIVIIRQIGGFLFIFFLGIIALTQALYLIGHNQKDEYKIYNSNLKNEEA